MQKEMRRAWDCLTAEERVRVQKSIVDYFLTEREEEVGLIAAGEVLDFFLQRVAPLVYNHAIEDVRNLLASEFERVDLEVGLIRKTDL